MHATEIIEKIVAGRSTVCGEVQGNGKMGFFKFDRIEIGTERIYVLNVPKPNPIDDMFVNFTGVYMSGAREIWIYHYNGENHVDAYDPSGKKHEYNFSEDVRLDQLHDMILQSFPSHMRSEIHF